MKQARWKLVALALSLAAVSPVWAASQGKKPNPEATQALLAAAMETDADAILAALEQGADPLVKDENDNTVLMLAVMGNFFGDEGVPVIDKLLAAKVPIEAKNKDGQTALMLAAREGQGDNVQLLIARGAKVNERSATGWTPLMLAAYNGQTSALGLLLEAKADVKNKDINNVWDALMLAISEGRGAAAEKLIEAGAVIPSTPVNGHAPLIHAVYGGDLQCVRMVLATKPDLTARDDDGWSGLAIAAYNGYPQIAMELLRAGIDPSLKDKEGKTALDRALEAKYIETAALLGAPWNKPEIRGTKIAIPCPVLGGDVQASFEVREDQLVVTTIYTKPMTYYLGGGMTNRADSAVKHTYDGSMAPAYHFDIDQNAKTGRKADPLTKGAQGSEYSLEYMEYGTSVSLTSYGPEEEEITKPVYANVLSADLTKLGESFDTGDYSPEAENRDGVLETKIPLSVLGVEKGKKVRVVATVGACGPKEATVEI